MIRAFLLYILFTVCIVSSCADSETKPLSRDKMTAVMTDIYMAEVYSSIVYDSTGISTNKNKDSLALYYKTVLHHHGITYDEFSASLRWYSSNPHELDSVYINILDELSTMEGMINAGAPQ